MQASRSHSAPKSRSRRCTLAAICAKTPQTKRLSCLSCGATESASGTYLRRRRYVRRFALLVRCLARCAARGSTPRACYERGALSRYAASHAACFAASASQAHTRVGPTGPTGRKASHAHDRPNPTVSLHQHCIQPPRQRGTPNQGWAASSQGRTHGLMSSTGVLWRISIAENSSSPGSAEQCSAMPSCATTRCSSAARSGAEHCRLRSAAQRSAARSVASQMMTVGRNTVQLDEREAYRVRPVGRARRKHPNLQS